MTASAVIGIISAVFSIVRFFVDYAQRQKWIDEGTAAVVLKSLQDSDDAISRAQNARQLVRASITRDPASVMRDDEFKRPSE